jgi:hypothetical protein
MLSMVDVLHKISSQRRMASAARQTGTVYAEVKGCTKHQLTLYDYTIQLINDIVVALAPCHSTG